LHWLGGPGTGRANISALAYEMRTYSSISQNSAIPPYGSIGERLPEVEHAAPNLVEERTDSHRLPVYASSLEVHRQPHSGGSDLHRLQGDVRGRGFYRRYVAGHAPQTGLMTVCTTGDDERHLSLIAPSPLGLMLSVRQPILTWRFLLCLHIELPRSFSWLHS
jgi:hypothetical protein